MHHVPPNRFLPDYTFFVSAPLEPRRPLFADAERARLVFDALQFFRSRREWELYGFVIMPDHVHFVARPLAPHTLPKLMRRLKGFIAHEMGLGPIWQKGYHSEVLIAEFHVRQKLRYVHENPVRAGLVKDPAAYPWSSAGEYGTDQPLARIDSFVGAQTTEKTAGGRH